MVAGDEYAIYLTEPEGFTLQRVSTEGADVVGHSLEELAAPKPATASGESAKAGPARIVRLRSAAGGRATWTISYARVPDAAR